MGFVVFLYEMFDIVFFLLYKSVFRDCSSAAACLSMKSWCPSKRKKTCYFSSTSFTLIKYLSFIQNSDLNTAFHQTMTKPSPMSTFVPVIVILYCTFRHQIEY